MSHKPWLLVLRGILKDRRGRYLLLRRSSFSRSWPRLWEFPGGKANPGEDIEDALRREFREETDLEVKSFKFLTAFEWTRKADRIFYLLFMAEKYSGKAGISREHEDLGWFTARELKRLKVSPPLVAVIREHLKVNSQRSTVAG